MGDKREIQRIYIRVGQEHEELIRRIRALPQGTRNAVIVSALELYFVGGLKDLVEQVSRLASASPAPEKAMGQMAGNSDGGRSFDVDSFLRAIVGDDES